MTRKLRYKFLLIVFLCVCSLIHAQVYAEQEPVPNGWWASYLKAMYGFSWDNHLTVGDNIEVFGKRFCTTWGNALVSEVREACSPKGYLYMIGPGPLGLVEGEEQGFIRSFLLRLLRGDLKPEKRMSEAEIASSLRLWDSMNKDLRSSGYRFLPDPEHMKRADQAVQEGIVAASRDRSRFGYPPAQEKNLWSPKAVFDRRSNYFFKQDEIFYSDLPPKIQELTKTIIAEAREQKTEVGFIAILLKDGEIVTTTVTSSHPDQIRGADFENGFKTLLASIDFRRVERIQFYHTHPDLDPMARSISTGDVEHAIYYASLLRGIGLKVPYDVHALPIQLATPGSIQTHVDAETFTRFYRTLLKPILLRMTVWPN